MSSSVIGALRVILGMDSAAFNNGVGEAQKRMAGLQKRMKRMSQSMTKIGRNMSLALTGPLVGAAYKSVAAQKAQEQAIAKVEAGLASMGQTAGFTSQELQKMASGLQEGTLFGDEDILSKVTANLLTFGNVQGDVFTRAQALALDLSALLGQDLQSSTIMLGKALNDPVKGLSALSRVGIQFTKQQEDQIKAMATAGDVAGAQALMLAELERQYKGQAQALADTDSGKITQAMNALGDASEKVGAIILPILADLAGYLKRAAERFQNLSPNVQRLIVVGGALAAGLGPLIAGFGLLIGAMAPLIPAFLALVSPIGLVVGAVAGAALLIWRNWDGLKQRFPGITNAISSYLSGVKQGFRNLWDAAKRWIAGVKDIFAGLADGIEALIKGDIKAALEAGRGVFNSFATMAKDIFRILFGDIVNKALSFGRDVVAKIKLGLDERWPGLTNKITTAMNTFKNAFDTGLATVTRIFGDLLVHIGNVMSWIGDDLAAFFSGEFSTVWQRGVDAVTKFGADVLAALAQLLQEVIVKALEIGQEIVNGIKEGLKQKWEELKAYAASLASDLMTTFRGIWGIKSPSRVFMGYGTNIVQGLERGIKGGLGLITSAMDAMTGALNVGGLKSEAESLGDGLETLGQKAADSMASIGARIGQAIGQAGSLKGALAGVLKVLGDVLIKQGQAAIGGAGGGSFFGSLLSGAIGGLLGFADGGSFNVGGVGGIDSQVVAFRASPNEHVSITKPGQGMSAMPPLVYAPQIDARGADAGAVARIEAQQQRMQAEFPARVVEAYRVAQKRRQLP
ncbi:phage tail length tape measure family protein [Roseovarius sp. MMSF_3350]|uniref:phage tail length tape measure family protein n=1 Tax=Roseovarius sp. MMSF_3350 TaxID=3046706 RepID=UPI00273DFF5E|nr:phage tail length tape measure family protein [Roseovarius sp. MMSF_3350]